MMCWIYLLIPLLCALNVFPAQTDKSQSHPYIYTRPSAAKSGTSFPEMPQSAGIRLTVLHLILAFLPMWLAVNLASL